MANFVKVIKPGLSTTVQDLGRPGHQIEGFPESGAMDKFSYKLANLLVNNHKNSASLEFVLVGPTLKFNCDSFIAITGGHVDAKLNQQPIKQNEVVEVQAGSILEIGQMTSGNYGYLAFSNGGVISQPVLDSRSTTLRTQMGGIDGRTLATNDNIPIRDSVVMPSLQARKIKVDFQTSTTVHFVKGPHWNMFSEQAQKQFVSQKYQISEQMDRMGYRLTGQPLDVPAKSLLSEGTVFGNVQITRDGSPIVLLADRQTTGGYPVIGTVIRADLNKFVQMKSGVNFKFVETDIQTATDKLVEQQRIINDTYEKWYANRYVEPIGPIRRNSIEIERLIRSNK
ncbi:biotin-dependent carboxyltransferase family protein [Companilactobacillus ginsenosidimutans]|uniref:Allophanate hydrolase n=1 Tax=Companilactobacillus ginsenosidimutans TaxID=1007676 RepID=A0A0H4QGF8_9LACO|nr:biotin-dependent carboxyltransferase family protein [Companilactobacillus ginsenosidimutans]AKP67489.1 allophanate hydrolase [Companilactobacillus ginsenosidimutans]